MTQLEAARLGIFTDAMRAVVEEEQISQDDLLRGIAEGLIVVPSNPRHTSLRAKGIGKGLRTKINVNIGTSYECHNPVLEKKKLAIALAHGADAIMDLSLGDNTQSFRTWLVQECPVPIGTVPIYDAVAFSGKEVKDISIDEWFAVVEQHARDGVDFMTIHAGLTQAGLERLRHRPRLTHIVSRGGSILAEWMTVNDAENPFYEHFDRLLEIARAHDITLSLGDGLRPGSLEDATDAAQIQELIILGELTLKAREFGVQVMIEGPGHVPLSEIVANIQLQKKLCHGAPFYVLGPLVTDIAPGYDHITAAIGGAIAAAAGADFICYVTPAEHLRLPNLDDVKEGLIAARIAGHAADIAKGVPGAAEWDRRMSRARAALDWPAMIETAIDPQKAKEYRNSIDLPDEQVCSMCGAYCAAKRSRELFVKSE
ncbi:MAG: phosphomethylpyrimidine synthase ThiC [candidate division KSB1 bacterium]|nr:phosphomethylpyrimidine synthase ThiC [candidate division KSB1 bacterium]